MEALAWMLIGHAIADYPLQGDWLSKAKNPLLRLTIEGLRGRRDPFRDYPGENIWLGAMACHCAIHAGFVKLATGSWLLAGCEFVAHFAIDTLKCRGVLNYNLDQASHFACKVFWASALLIFGALP